MSNTMSSIGVLCPSRADPHEQPLTNHPRRHEWVEDVGQRTASEYKSYIANHLSKNTIHKMLIPENIARADTDGGGTIDKREFGALLASSGVDTNSADMQASLLFAEADKDGDGELTLEELKRIVDYKAQK